MSQYSAENILSTPAFTVSATFEAINLFAKHFNEKPEDIMLAFINSTPNVVIRIQEVVHCAAQAMAEKLNKEQGEANV